MNTGLEGRVAIVTGAAGGIGQEVVRDLLGAGAKVAALDVDETRLDELASGFRKHPGRVVCSPRVPTSQATRSATQRSRTPAPISEAPAPASTRHWAGDGAVPRA